MTYKQKCVFLLSLITVLALLYAGSFIFSPEKNNARSASHVWLDKKFEDRINRIVINSTEQAIELLKKNNQWFVLFNGIECPARQKRVEDLLDILTKRTAWPLRSSSASSHSRFGLDVEEASRLIVYTENTVLLDLLAGYRSGREVFLRKYSQNEVRSGDNKIISYITSPEYNWYNLGLIQDDEGRGIDAEDVQRFSVYNEGETLVFSRQNKKWIVSGVKISDPVMEDIENYLRTILNSEGEDFVDSVYSNDPVLNYSRIVLELGNGKVITIRFSALDEKNYRLANVSGSEYIYSIPMWVSNRIFRDASSFSNN